MSPARYMSKRSRSKRFNCHLSPNQLPTKFHHFYSIPLANLEALYRCGLSQTHPTLLATVSRMLYPEHFNAVSLYFASIIDGGKFWAPRVASSPFYAVILLFCLTIASFADARCSLTMVSAWTSHIWFFFRSPLNGYSTRHPIYDETTPIDALQLPPPQTSSKFLPPPVLLDSLYAVGCRSNDSIAPTQPSGVCVYSSPDARTPPGSAEASSPP
ncbi:hypothetical protein R3P38DRAFT_2804668 [Favolaschia claudopus]|uniref:Uncharacterized protein n=1 Tax=Favolaschia claudopus TaxID=2862362 RepID=A0AAV9ZPH0_9AGAR